MAPSSSPSAAANRGVESSRCVDDGRGVGGCEALRSITAIGVGVSGDTYGQALDAADDGGGKKRPEPNRAERRGSRGRGVSRHQLKFVGGPMHGQSGTHPVAPKRLEVPNEETGEVAVYVRKNTRAGVEYWHVSTEAAPA